MNDLSIVPATSEDAQKVLTFYSCLLAEHLPYIMDNPAPTLEQEIAFIQRHDGKRSLLLLAHSGEQVVGMCGYQIAAHQQLSHVCSLGISVHKAFRSQGIGRRLIAAGEKWCRSRAVYRLEFEVVDGNPAVVFYQRLGFEIEGRKRKAIKVGDDFRDLIIMAKMFSPK
jgi:GNAT superfamily N-acetyltransferase